MTRKFARFAALVAVTSLSLLTAATAQEVAFQDPTGDDNGPGTYTYPTDTVYKPGTFDLTGFALKVKGDKATVEVSVNSNLEDPWRMGGGFSLQMVFVFIDTDGKEGSGFTKGVPGTNVTFAPKDAWDKCIILSPQAPGRVRNEVETKAAAMKAAIVIPDPHPGLEPDDQRQRGPEGPGTGRPEHLGVPGRDAVQRGLPRRGRPDDPQGQRVRGAAPIRRGQRRRLRPARDGRPRGQGHRGQVRDRRAEADAQVRVQPGRNGQGGGRPGDASASSGSHPERRKLMSPRTTRDRSGGRRRPRRDRPPEPGGGAQAQVRRYDVHQVPLGQHARRRVDVQLHHRPGRRVRRQRPGLGDRAAHPGQGLEGGRGEGPPPQPVQPEPVDELRRLGRPESADRSLRRRGLRRVRLAIEPVHQAPRRDRDDHPGLQVARRRDHRGERLRHVRPMGDRQDPLHRPRQRVGPAVPGLGVGPDVQLRPREDLTAAAVGRSELLHGQLQRPGRAPTASSSSRYSAASSTCAGSSST